MNSFSFSTRPLPTSFEGVFFVTLRLWDALPENFGQNLGIQYYTSQVKFAHFPDGASKLHQARKRLFARFDQALDLEKYGHSYLREPELTHIVAAEIRRLDGVLYDLRAFSLMPNHVHLLIRLQDKALDASPLDDFECIQYQPLRDIVRKIQGATELPLKKALRRLPTVSTRFQKYTPKGSVKIEGKFWHERSFDFQLKDAVEFEKVSHYILQNPVRAELGKDSMD
jgi:putative transposase